MTVSNQDITAGPYTGNGVADTFSYGFRVEDKTEMKVYETGTGGRILLTVDTDYTVNNVGDESGTVTRTAGPLPSGYKWFIRSDYADTQETEFESQGAFFPDIHEKAMDKLTRLVQQLRDLQSRALAVDEGYDGDYDLTIPDPVEGELLRFTDTGIEGVTLGDMLAEAATIVASLSMNGYRITNLADAISGTDAVNKQYVDNTKISKADGNNTMAQDLDMGGNKVSNLARAESGSDAVNLTQVIEYLTGAGVDGVIPTVQPRQVGDGTTTVYSTPTIGVADASPNSFFVTLDGVTQRPITDFSINTGGYLEFVEAPTLNTAIDITYFNPVSLGDLSTAAVTATGTTTPRTLGDRFADVVNVKDFGVVGDGVTDDTAAVRGAHTHANSVGARVKYDGVSTIAIQADAKIPINTSVDFNWVEFKILNGVNTPPSFFTLNELYVIEDPSTPLVEVVGTVTGDLKEGSYTPTKGLFDGAGFAVLRAGLQVSNRERDGTKDYEQSFYVERDGDCAKPLSTDLTAYQNNITVKYRKASETGVTITNLKVKDAPNDWNNQIFLSIYRNNVTVRGLTLVHNSEPDFDNIDNILRVQYAGNIKIEDVHGSNRSTTNFIASYVLEMDYVAEVFLDNFNVIWRGSSSNGTNHVNGYYVQNSTLVRVDAHEGGHNIFVDNCTFVERGVGYGWGGGQIKITNCVAMFVGAIVETRVDYGGEFFGDIIVDGIEYDANWTGTALIADITGGSTIPTQLPNAIILDNVRWRGVSVNTYDGVMSMELNRRGVAEVYAPSLIRISNWSSKVNMYLNINLDLGSMSRKVGEYRTTLEIQDCTCERIPKKGDGILLLTPSFVPASPVSLYITTSNTDMILIEEGTSEVLRQVDMSNCGVSGVVCNNTKSSRPSVYMTGGELRYPAADFTGQVEVGANASGGDRRTKLTGVTVHAVDFDLSYVASSIGTSFLTGAITPTLPAGATFTTMFTGWQSGYRT